jgi:hypothetical protein
MPNPQGGTVDNSLPKIVAFHWVQDTGPADPRPNGTCPHCGAEGRWINWFYCDDGKEHGAMNGCLQLFPQSETASVHKKILDKLAQKKKLNGWDEKMLDAIHKLSASEITEEEALSVIHKQQALRSAWMSKKFRR